MPRPGVCGEALGLRTLSFRRYGDKAEMVGHWASQEQNTRGVVPVRSIEGSGWSTATGMVPRGVG